MCAFIRNFFIIFFLLFIIFSKSSVFAKDSYIIIINQVRGNEVCCQAGNLDLITNLINNRKINKLPFGWALRYDALQDRDMTDKLIGFGELGLLLEITPGLALDSKVIYKGENDGSDWYYGKNSLLIGYSQEERKKIIDRLFTVFNKRFGFFPEFTVAWMIDSWSLSYIHSQYGVKLHELTKEQYETDTYTLYGGVFNAPYYPSFDHPLIPGQDNNKSELVIVRQTISDLLKNYGSSKAYFTSQPNDYLGGLEKLNKFYFQELVSDVTSQTSEFGFGILGFENSFSFEKYGNEYIKQLEYIVNLQSKNKIKTVKPSDYAKEFKNKYKENPVFYLQKDFMGEKNPGILWYFGKTYRARLLRKDGKIILDDLRIYGQINDPYKNIPAASDYSYWIVPYLFDGSQQYQISDKKVDKNIKELIGSITVPDYLTSPFGIILGKGSFNLQPGKSFLEIEFTGETKGKVKFLPEEIYIDRSLSPSFNFPKVQYIEETVNKKQKKVFPFAKHFDFTVVADKGSALLGWEREGKFIDLAGINIENDLIKLTPNIQINNIKLLDPIFQPDRSGLEVNVGKSIFYWNNKEAVAGRNPIRLFILPQNILGRPTSVEKLQVDSPDKNKLKIIYPDDYSFRIKPWFIDILSNSPLKSKITLSVDGVRVIENASFEFVSDCQKNLEICLKHPLNLLKYIKLLLVEQKVKAVLFITGNNN